MFNYETYKSIFQGRAMPLAYVDLDLLDTNIRQILKRAGGKQIRIASKSVRSLALLRRIQAADPKFQGFMCFTAAEAVFLSQQGLDDLLVGYPCWQKAQILDICNEIRQGKTITLMLDSVEHALHLEEIAHEQQVFLPVCLDLDMSLDMPGL